MGFMTRLEKAKQELLATTKPATTFELKYSKITDAKKAWDIFFKHFRIRLTGIKAKAIAADVTDLITTKQKVFLDDVYSFLDDVVIAMSETVKEFVALMHKYQDSDDAFQQALVVNYTDLVDSLNDLKQKTKIFIHKAQQEKVEHTQKYKQYEKYLTEVLSLTADSVIGGFLNNKIPLEGFDDEFLGGN